MFSSPVSSPRASLNGDDFAIGEILISLKRDPVVHDVVQPMLLPGTVVGAQVATNAPYRGKMGLTVRTPSPDDSTAFDPFSSSTVSPVASTLYSLPAPAQSPSERTKRYGPVIQLEDLRKCFNMPIATVARQFGICATLLKKICRRHGIQRWPHRQIRSLQKSIDMLRESLAVAKGSNKEYIAKKIAAFEHTLECIMQDPNTAAKGISSGRLASPASEELAKRAKRVTVVKKLESSAALASLSDDEDEQDMVAPWSPSAASQSEQDDRKDSMSLKSILC
ncbi:hypothetical protein Poli38472_001595 [Pythium oligandrum]|uniref:RWP-RK domain-containing protein n=1 Tax=Pythium oligandrum TaxID=41045 RepID=A0A8K1CUF1_PYTOL|nr:hypothetical protein Poli38472_001595 [Pythium oligandrum]|eukprot:TMW69439.1 hypothetical protein Poli38472_001595 [Pythium oligandrum]